MNRGNRDGEGRGECPGGGRGGVNLPAVRGHNEALLLGLLRGAGSGGLGRADLADRTGLTPQAVSKITARLAGEGLVTEAGRGASTGGKPRTLLRLVPDARHAVGVHLDRDELTAVRVDLTGGVVARRRGPLDFAAGPDAAVAAVLRAVVRVSDPGGAGAPLLGVGVAAPGPLDWRDGVPGRVTGFPEWEGFPLREALAAALPGAVAGAGTLAVVVDKDTNAGVAAAAGHEAGNCVYLHLGTGLGAGLRLDGAVFRGPRSLAGEFGHQVLELDGPPCRCGGRGCAEALCLAALERGDLAGAARVLGEGAANVVALLDVDRVLLGGRVVEAEPEAFVEGVRAVLARRRTGGAPVVGVARAGVAEGAAELVLGPMFGRRL
ncbi:ROK family transcriptional regulator [Streptomyces sp. NPDC046557]|uniref:ROK family transcriptional regulator n=1 Tax=Streptomyces sp. NPDC046557 TaxID=3155372 RepID=UPI0033CFAF93